MPTGIYERKPYMKTRKGGISPKLKRWLLEPEHQKIAGMIRKGEISQVGIAERFQVSLKTVQRIAAEVRLSLSGDGLS